jgi:hypothetical protein
MAKAIKSFNVEKETYDALITLFKKHGASTSLSFFVEQCLVKLLANLSEVDEALQKTEHYPQIMKFIIERWCHDLVITTRGERPAPMYMSSPREYTIDPESAFIHSLSAESEDDDLTPTPLDGLPGGETFEELEALYWTEEYEADKQNLPRVFVRLLKTGRFNLSRNKRVLIEKETGKKFLNLDDNHVIEIATPAKVLPKDEE